MQPFYISCLVAAFSLFLWQSVSDARQSIVQKTMLLVIIISNGGYKQKKQRAIRKRITLCFFVKPFLHKFGVNVVSNQPNRVDKRRGINAF